MVRGGRAKSISMHDDAKDFTPTQTGFTSILPAPSSKADPAPLLEESYKSFRLNCLQLIDSRRFHYLVMLVLFVDFFGNCVAVSFTSTDNFVKYGGTARLFSSVFTGLYAMDMLLRVMSLRGGILRNAASTGDVVALVCATVVLGGRFWKADNVKNVVITEGDWVDKYKLEHKYISNQIEQYVTAVYCFFVAIRIVLKPPARTFSKKLHKYANHDNLRISMASLRTSIRRIPGITAVAVETMEFDLTIVCGRDEGDMSREELMQFLQKALLYRPKDLSANAFLAHLRDIDAMASYAVYGAYDVVKSTFRHW
ncbi:hypothetical protein DYB34_009051 [Aphanomyces astaci]|uniref:Uncharacterized protein n=1 Tax=Aphanomyces astaci TaxID=112090 RepID=A0A397AKY8_APHAT|nr:hypothetical protein DYB36_009009 [Aphanomyces astaci]RHY56977.1 hypothetical protein DYB34_009051 [Aphanomyces astaci]